MSARRVLIVMYAHPSGFPPVERAARILHSDGWAVRIIGARGLETDALGVSSLAGIDVRLVDRGGHGARQKLQYAGFLLRCAYHLLTWRPAWVYTSDLMATPAGLLAAIAGMRVLYHEHDAPTDERPSRFVRALLRARSALLRRAAILVTPNAARSEAMSAEANGRSVITAWNCPLASEVATGARTPPSGALKLAYHGSIVPGRPPIAILDAMARTSGRVELTVAGYETNGTRGFVQQLADRARALGIEDRLTLLPAMPRRALLEIAARSDLGLSFMPGEDGNWNEVRMAGASNKAFEYLASGVPLLVSELPDWKQIFVRAGVAWACDANDVDSLVRVLDQAIGDRATVAAMGERGRQLVLERWNYETQFAPVLRAMNRAVNGASDDATR